nr:transcription antiterminator [uncultured Bacillus sp.]
MKVEVKKTLNNNVLIAKHSSYGEVVVIGKGIGFNRKSGESIDTGSIEKLFILKNEKEQKDYIKLLSSVDNDAHEVIISAMNLIKNKVNAPLNEHIHVALTDHLMFTFNRVFNGMEIKNPFLVETKTLYPVEYGIAQEVVQLIAENTGIRLPAGEIGFIALHIHSSINNRNIGEINQDSQLVTKLIQMIEQELKIKIDKDSIDYTRLVRHLHYTIVRVKTGEIVEEQEKISFLLKEEYPVCYNLAWKLIKMMQQALSQPVYDSEAVYLTMHLQRLQKKIK